MFANLPYDYYVLWAAPPIQTPGVDPRDPYFDIFESHLKFIHASPPLISRLLHLVIGVGILGLIIKLYKPTEANKLFDGASLVLYMCGVTVYSVNLVKGMRAASAGIYGDKTLAPDEHFYDKATEGTEGEYIGREDSLRVISASHTILAFVLIGVLILQAGQWYAQRKEAEEIEQLDQAAADKKKAGAVSKKKQ